MTFGRSSIPEGAGSGEGARSLELRTFALIGLVPQQVTELVSLFRTGDKASVIERISDEAGHPWVRAFETRWGDDEKQARRDALFDLTWHRRARELDPLITARNFAGFDVLLQVASQIAPDVHLLLRHIDPNDHSNERCREGPDWWSAWHEAAGTSAGGWLELEEIRQIWQNWSQLTTPEVERACLDTMGATYTHPGCWSLLNDLSGFFAQCVSERRAALAEVDV